MGGGRGGCRPAVGNKIRDGKIHLVSHRRDDRDFGSRNDTGKSLVIEAPQILRRAATPSQNDDIHRLLRVAPDGR